MNKKINTICFIFLLVFLISAVSAADSENETIQSIQQPDPNEDLCEISVENNKVDTLKQSEIQEENLQVKQDVEKLSATQKVETKKKITLSAPNVKMYYKDGSKFTVTLKYNKKVIGNAKIKIQINGQTYTRTTDNTGKASINLNFNSGTYTVLSSCAGNSEFESASAKSTVTIKSTVKCSDFTKYYKNTAAYYPKFYDKKGKLLKNTNVKIKLNSKTYTVKTDSKGVGKLAIDLKPGKYSIVVTNSKTSESITKTVTINSLIEAKDLTLNESQKGKFNVKIYNSYGKISPNKKVTIKLNGKTYTKTTNKNGIATLEISNLKVGKYTITTEYSGLKSTNKITVNKIIKKSNFIHTTLIPNYVNATLHYVFQNSAYSLKTGFNGTVKMPKNEIFTIEVGGKTYLFSNMFISGVETQVIGYQSHLIPFDGSGIKSNINKDNLQGNGIIISKINGYTQIDYRSNTNDNVELFGFYADKGFENSETLTYMQNDKVTARINFITYSFDEMGVKYSLSKYYQKSIYDFNYKSYDELTNYNADKIRFTNTNTPVTFNYFGRSIVGYTSKEDIITKFVINGKEEVKRHETISYGFSDKYQKTIGFEVLQTYSIINEKITKELLTKWISLDSKYISRLGVKNVYGMHLASLETTWLADLLAENYSKEYDVNWDRGHTLTILGGINLDKTYLNILNADMGMNVKGNEKNCILFRIANSMNLPNLESIAFSQIADRYSNDTANSLNNILSAIVTGNFSISQLGEMVYLVSENSDTSTIIINTTSGVSSVINYENNNIYKGASISTACDCCSVGMIVQDIFSGINNAFKQISSGIGSIMNKLTKKSYSVIKMGYNTGMQLFKYVGTVSMKVGVGLFGTMTFIQNIGTDFRSKILDKIDWHTAMDIATFTRPGYLQNKKVYNIPNNKGGYDYLEVPIKDDLTLDRNNAVYISNGKTRKLTKEETYKYFKNDEWNAISLPTQYWDDSWKGIVK